MDRANRQRIPYQQALRSLGAYLDEIGACWVKVIEERRGYLVCYQRDRDRPDVKAERFAYTDVLALQTEEEALRGSGEQVDTFERDTGYQDFLRALGHELDEAEAYEILLDELEDGHFLVTYQHTDREAAMLWKKHMAVVGLDERRTILEHAHARRAYVPRRGRWNLLG